MRPGLMLLACLGLGFASCAWAQLGAEPEPRAELQQLAAEFFAWRRMQQPIAKDPISRVERPAGWLPKYSPADLAIYRVRYREFLEQLNALNVAALAIAEQVDALVLASAIKRVGWELDVLRAPQRNALFYLDQTLGSVFELLVLSSPLSADRFAEIVLRLEHFTTTVENAKQNLREPSQPFALAAVESLLGIEERLTAVQAGLNPLLTAEQQTILDPAVTSAALALLDYRGWLQSRLSEMAAEFHIGLRAYEWYLGNVALIPYTRDELLAQGRHARNQALVGEMLEHNRNRDLPQSPIFVSLAAQMEAAARHEQEIRNFLNNQDLLSVPETSMHFRLQPMPPYLAPLAFLGIATDMSSQSRLLEDAVHYTFEPSADMNILSRSAATDPRPLIAHEGIPGHHYQLTQSWSNPDPIRRRFVDSSANEGIASYAEEMLLRAGLYSFSPRTRELQYSLMRLRAAQVEVDIQLATGGFNIEQAAEFLSSHAPMDQKTAAEEALRAAVNPGYAMGYQIGKLQIEKFLADAREQQGDAFSLRHFHDALMRNGNVPIALQRWEYLQKDEEIQSLRALGSRAATVPY